MYFIHIIVTSTFRSVLRPPSKWCFYYKNTIEFNVHVTVHHSKFLIIKPTRCTIFSNLFLEFKFYMFRTVPLSIIRSFLLCTAMIYDKKVCWQLARKLSANLASCQQTCLIYTSKLFVRNPCGKRNSWSEKCINVQPKSNKSE